jgi:hypothetical protein
MDDVQKLIALNAVFIDAFRLGSWVLLGPILSPNFSYLDGATGEVWPIDRYIADLDGRPAPALEIDQVRVHVDGDVAMVTARSFTSPGCFNRYLDTYERRESGWLCIHACVWPLPLD